MIKVYIIPSNNRHHHLHIIIVLILFVTGYRKTKHNVQFIVITYTVKCAK